MNKILFKLAKYFAPGIPDQYFYGDPLKNLHPGDIVDYILQKHETKRRPGSPHYDLRLGTQKTNLYSWAVPGAKLPEEGEFKTVPQTHLHAHQYGSFEGEIDKGYGAGKVTLADKGKAIITRVTPNTIHFTIGHSKVPTRYVLINIKGKDGKLWRLFAVPTPKNVPGVGIKPIIKTISAEDQDEAISQAAEVQEKIDGAHGIVNVDEKGDVNVYSVRKSVKGLPIRHTERLGLFGLKVPTRLAHTSYRGEIYFKDKHGKAIPFKDISGILNSKIYDSLLKQKRKGLKPQIALFDTYFYRGKNVEDFPYELRKQYIKEFLKQIHSDIFREPRSAKSMEEKLRLINDIKKGLNLDTMEGVVLKFNDGKEIKIKNTKELTAILKGLYRGKGKRKDTAGGIVFETDEGVEGHVGTGFTDKELEEISRNLDEYLGKPIRIGYMQKFKSGKLRAPSFKGFETDK